MTPEEALQVFIAKWDKNGDNTVTLEEFIEYYEWISASIDNDDYFELMMRNGGILIAKLLPVYATILAWRISGGTGWAANTANLRVLVTHTDGSQTVEEVKVGSFYSA
jgi:hypothetical protein